MLLVLENQSRYGIPAHTVPLRPLLKHISINVLTRLRKTRESIILNRVFSLPLIRWPNISPLSNYFIHIIWYHSYLHRLKPILTLKEESLGYFYHKIIFFAIPLLKLLSRHSSDGLTEKTGLFFHGSWWKSTTCSCCYLPIYKPSAHESLCWVKKNQIQCNIKRNCFGGKLEWGNK